jgi:hypothetical protein
VSGLIRSVMEICPAAGLFPTSHLVTASNTAGVTYCNVIRHAGFLDLPCLRAPLLLLGCPLPFTWLAYSSRLNSDITCSGKPYLVIAIWFAHEPKQSQPSISDLLIHTSPLSSILL